MELERLSLVPRLAPRAAESHKGDYGTVLVVAGSRGMAGAAALAGQAALRAGAGLVKIACPAEIQPTVAGFDPCYMTWPLAAGVEGTLRDGVNRERLDLLAGQADAVVVGPGLGQGPELAALVEHLLERVTGPVVLDADGLNVLGRDPGCLKTREKGLIITPHPGEFSRLTGIPVGEIQRDRLAAAAGFTARQSRELVVVLKGRHSLVVGQGRLYENQTGNAGMATGGSGDVLSGVIGALAAGGLPGFESAVLGTYIHGLAGDLASDHLGETSLIARDILEYLASAFRRHAASAGS